MPNKILTHSTTVGSCRPGQIFKPKGAEEVFIRTDAEDGTRVQCVNLVSGVMEAFHRGESVTTFYGVINLSEQPRENA